LADDGNTGVAQVSKPAANLPYRRFPNRQGVAIAWRLRIGKTIDTPGLEVCTTGLPMNYPV
jgi:hypothetical protein